MAQLMRTSNPTLNDKVFQNAGVAYGQETMTVAGTVNKTGILLVLALLTSVWTWNLFLHSRSPEAVMPLAALGAIGGFIVAIVTVFKNNWSPVTAPLYALLEGLVLGSVSALFEVRFPGLPTQAVSLTFGVLIVLLLAYRSGLIPVTDKFVSASSPQPAASPSSTLHNSSWASSVFTSPRSTVRVQLGSDSPCS